MDLVDFSHDFVDKNISELINNGNYKQALKNVEKKLKKPAKTQHLAILRAALLLEIGDSLGAHELCQTILTQPSALQSGEIRDLLFYILAELKEDGFVEEKTIEELWTKAIALQQGKQKTLLAERWVSLSIERVEWAYVVKAAQQLYTLSPRGSTEAKRYRIWQSLARYMVHLEKQRSTFPMKGSDLDRQLAVRALQQAAKDTPEPSEVPKENVLSITSSQELKLLAEVLQREGLNGDLLTALAQEKFLRVMSDDYAFDYTRSELFKTLLPVNRVEAIGWARRIIESAKQRSVQWQLDDWSAWNILLEAYSAKVDADRDEDTISASSEDFHKVVAENMSSNPKSRSADLARRRFDARMSELERADNGESGGPNADRSDAYLAGDGTASDSVQSGETNDLDAVNETFSLAFDSFVAKDDKTQNNRLLGPVMDKLSSLMQGLNISCERDVERKAVSKAALHKAVLNCLRLFKLYRSQDGAQPPSDVPSSNMIMLRAVQALQHIGTRFEDVTATYLSYLCTLLPASSKQDLDARFGLIKALQDRGASSLAWARYQELEVKSLIIEPMAPMMFCRIASTAAAPIKGLDIRQQIPKMLDFYTKTLGSVPQWQELALNSDNFTEAIGMGDFIYELKASPVRWMMGLERRRIARLLGNSYDADDDMFSPSKLSVRLSPKTRDPWIYGPGPALSRGYVDFLAQLDDIAELVHCAKGEESKVVDRLDWREKTLSASTKACLLEVEIEILGVCNSVLQVHQAIDGELEGLTDALQGLFQSLSKMFPEGTETRLSNAMGRDPLPSHDQIVTYSLNLELSRNCHLFCQKLSSRVKKQNIRPQLDEIKTRVNDRSKAILGLVQKQRKALQILENDQVQLQNLMGLEANSGPDELPRIVVDMVGHDRAVNFMKALVASCRISLEGLEKIKLA